MSRDSQIQTWRAICRGNSIQLRQTGEASSGLTNKFGLHMVNELSWQIPETCRTLDEGDVHVFTFRLNPPAEVRESLATYLSEEESARAARFRFERDRHRFVVGRGVLRSVLGEYVEAPPEKIQFHYNAQGKPML